MAITIRHETPADYFAVETLIRNAFWNLYVPGCEEHYLAHQIRKHPDYLPDLSFLLELDNEIIGSIFYTRSCVMTPSEIGRAHV